MVPFYTVKVEGVDKFIADMKDLGINRIPNYVARALTEVANQVQDSMILNARSMLVIRGAWLAKGTKFGINRKAASKTNLQAEVSTTAPWLIQQEEQTTIKPRAAGSLAVPFIWQRTSRLAVTRSPKRQKDLIKLPTKFHGEILYKREGHGRISHLIPMFILRKQTPQKKRVHLIQTGTQLVNKVAAPVIAGMVQQAINESKG